MILEKTFGEMIRNLREDRKLTLREVASVLAIDTSMLGKIEKNSRKPTKTLIEKIARFFNISGKDLMIAFLSDTIVHQILAEEEYASEILRVAEEKVKYLTTKPQ